MIFDFLAKKSLIIANEYKKNGLFRKASQHLSNNFIFLLFQSPENRNMLLFIQGIFLFHNGKFKKSLLLLKKSVYLLNSDQDEAFFYIIKCYLQLNNPLSAVDFFLKNQNRMTINSYFFLSLLELKRNGILSDTIPYEEIIKNAAYENKTEFSSLLIETTLHLLFNDVEGAFKNLGTANKLFQKEYLFNYLYIKTLFIKKCYFQIIKYFEGNFNSLQSFELLRIYAGSLFHAKLYHQSETILQLLLSLSPDHEETIINLSLMYKANHKFTKAISLLTSFSDKKLKNKNLIFFIIGNCYFHLGLFRDAIQYYGNIDENSQWYHKSLFNISLLLYDMDDLENSKIFFSKINPAHLPDQLYHKWKFIFKNLIINKKRNILKFIICLFPVFIAVISIIVFILFTIFREV